VELVYYFGALLSNDGSLFFSNANVEVDVEDCILKTYDAVLIGNLSRISEELAATIFMVCAAAM